jgi:hypothetical protein
MERLYSTLSPEGALTWLAAATQQYLRWWWSLSPVHVVIETAIIIGVLYILLVKRSYDPVKR